MVVSVCVCLYKFTFLRFRKVWKNNSFSSKIIKNLVKTHLPKYGDFLSGGKKLSGFHPGHKIDKTRVNSARNGQKVRKTRRNDCETFFMTSDSQKMISRFLDSYFCTKFQISQPGWYPDQAIKIRQMGIFVKIFQKNCYFIALVSRFREYSLFRYPLLIKMEIFFWGVFQVCLIEKI